jgi:broad specificity phosphatase PhoE
VKLYFVRHGESEANLLREFSNRGVKHPLTATGCEQALALAHALRGIEVTRIFASPVLRAVQTAEIVAGELGWGYEVVDALREYDVGVLEGRADAASWQRYWEINDAWLVRHEWDARIEQGESFLDIRRRFVPFIEQLVHDGATNPASNIVLVGHGGTYRCMLPLVLDNIDFPFVLAHGMGHADVVVAELTANGLTCLAWGDLPFDGFSN